MGLCQYTSRLRRSGKAAETHQWQSRPRDLREVVVLVVVADVEVEQVARAVVRVRLEVVDKLIVLRDQVASCNRKDQKGAFENSKERFLALFQTQR